MMMMMMMMMMRVIRYVEASDRTYMNVQIVIHITLVIGPYAARYMSD